MATASAHGNALTQTELATRVSMLKRFRQLLIEQRERFRHYLDSLDTQKNIIANGSVDELAAHVELEEKIVADIVSIEKCIQPMRTFYETAKSSQAGQELSDVPELTAALDNLKLEAARRVTENKELLQSRMSALRGELKNLRANPFTRGRRSVFADTQPAFLDLKG